MLLRIFTSLWLLAFAAVATADTRIDVNWRKNFSKLKTFTVDVSAPINIFGNKDKDNPIAKDRFRAAVTRELKARGLKPVASGADLTVKVSSREVEQTAVVGGGYPYGYPGYWSAGYWGGNVYTYNYTQGYVQVDVIENATRDLVYRGEYDDDVDKNLDKEVNKAVHKALKKYPVIAQDTTDH
jgi:hypothetical protein